LKVELLTDYARIFTVCSRLSKYLVKNEIYK